MKSIHGLIFFALVASTISSPLAPRSSEDSHPRKTKTYKQEKHMKWPSQYGLGPEVLPTTNGDGDGYTASGNGGGYTDTGSGGGYTSPGNTNGDYKPTSTPTWTPQIGSYPTTTGGGGGGGYTEGGGGGGSPTETFSEAPPSPTGSGTSSAPGDIGIPSGCYKKNGVNIGWLPDNGVSIMTIQDKFAPGTKPCFFGQYSQIQSGGYNDDQLTEVLSDVLQSGAVFITSVMPSIAFSEVTPDIAQQVATSMNNLIDQGVPEIWLRFAHEMNYYAGPDGGGVYTGTASEFQTAWSNVASATRGNPKVRMYWSPNNDGGNPQSLKDGGWWPNPANVDIVGIDIYPKEHETFEQAYKPFHDMFAAAYDKPFAIGETGYGSGSADADKQYWLEQVSSAATFSSCPKYVGFSWFEYLKGGTDFRVATGSTNIAAAVLA